MIRRAVLAGLVALGLSGCDDGSSVTYSYFLVPVTIDRQSVDEDLLALVAHCGAEAHVGTRRDGVDLRCVRGRIPYELGKFEYTTTQTSGAVRFVVELFGINHNPLARGESMPAGIVPGKTVDVPPVVVRAIPGAMREPPGVPLP